MAEKTKKSKKQEEKPREPLNLGGRPPSFSSPQELIDIATEYFDSCAASRTLPNKAGLAIFMKVSRDTLHTYSRKEGPYSDAMSAIYHYIEDAWVQRLGHQHPTGAIFYLKNAFQYRDVVEQTGTTAVVFVLPPEIASKHQLAAPIQAEAVVLPPEAAVPIAQPNEPTTPKAE